MKSNDIYKQYREEWRKLWTRIESTKTGHISGRSIWDSDTNNFDDEAHYEFIDETIESFWLEKLEQQAKEIREKISELATQGKDDPDDQKGLLLYARIMKYLSESGKEKAE